MKNFVMAASAMAVLGLALPMAQASSVDLSTYATSDGSGWTVVRTAPASNPGATENVVDVNPVNSNWIASLGASYSNALWVSDNAGSGNGTSDEDQTVYTYSKTFSLDFSSDNTLQLTGEFAADNYVQSVDLYQNNTLVANLFTNTETFAQKIYGFQSGIPLTGGATGFSQTQTFTLQVTAVNDDGPGVGGDFSGPTGFMLGGTAQTLGTTQTAVAPLPEAAAMGMSLLGAMGGMSAIRKRLRRS
jgi:hypothetical protein